jgi:primosomal protein N' (replication factor Y)
LRFLRRHRRNLSLGSTLTTPAGFPSRRLLLQCRMIDESRASETLAADAPLFADVIVPRHFAGPFTYLVPAPLRPVLRVGHLVFVPFGSALVQGAVIALTPHHPPTLPLERLKTIRTLVTTDGTGEIPPPSLQLARAVAEAYVAPWGQCLRLVLPPKSKILASPRIILTKEGQEALRAKKPPSAAMMKLLTRLKRRPLGISLSRLTDGKDRNHGDVLSVLERGWAHRVSGRSDDARPEVLTLSHDAHRQASLDREETPTDHEWHARLDQALKVRTAARLLLQGDATERLRWLRSATAKTMQLGRKVLVITGETARAESLAAALADPCRMTAVLHGGMSDNRRAAVWDRIRQNDVSVVVGTRAAVFVPLRPLGLIWIDREEDPALKEPMEPRYRAGDVAWMRAQEEQALLVLSSAHLSLEACGLEPAARVLKSSRRREALPQIEVVDLRRENPSTLLSPRLQEAIGDAIARRAGALLFLNRKAYAGALVCQDCGQIPRCISCAVALAFSRQKNLLFCHYCGATRALPDYCAMCASPRVQPVGQGTERVEEEVRRRFPSARVLRVDGESTRKTKDAVEIWTRIQRREWDVLVGTQVLLRDDAVPSVGVAGAVQADAGLSVPDFRAAERTFHLLHDAASLVQPRSDGGRFLIQSYLPHHHVIEAVLRQDEAIFTSEELSHRTALAFPPVVRMIVLHISGAFEPTVDQAAQAWAAALSRAARATLESADVTIFGPVQSPVARIRGRYRRQILIKSHHGSKAVQTVRSTLTDLESMYARQQVKFDVDVDPLEMW